MFYNFINLAFVLVYKTIKKNIFAHTHTHADFHLIYKILKTNYNNKDRK